MALKGAAGGARAGEALSIHLWMLGVMAGCPPARELIVKIHVGAAIECTPADPVMGRGEGLLMPAMVALISVCLLRQQAMLAQRIDTWAGPQSGITAFMQGSAVDGAPTQRTLTTASAIDGTTA